MIFIYLFFAIVLFWHLKGLTRTLVLWITWIFAHHSFMISLLRTQNFTWLELKYGHFFYHEVLRPSYFLLCSLPKLTEFHRCGGSPWESLLFSSYSPSASVAFSTLAPDKLNRLGGDRQPVQRGRSWCSPSLQHVHMGHIFFYEPPSCPTSELSALGLSHPGA